MSGTVVDHLSDTGVATVSEEVRSGLTAEPPAGTTDEQTSEQIASSILEPVDCDSEKGHAESKPVVETSNVQTAASSNTVDSDITEPLPEANKGQFETLRSLYIVAVTAGLM